MILFFQNVTQIPVYLGPLGTILLSTYGFMVTLASVWLWWKRDEINAVRRESARWQGAAEAYESNLEAKTKTVERLEAEKQALERRVGEAEAKTDLRPLLEQYQRIAEHQLQFAEQFQVEVRENQEVHVRIVEKLGHVDDRTREILDAIRQSVEVTKLNIEVTQGVQRTANALVELMADKLLVLLDRLTTEVSAGGATGLRVERQNVETARSRAASHQRANNTVSDEAGAAADAAAKQTEKEKLDG